MKNGDVFALRHSDGEEAYFKEVRNQFHIYVTVNDMEFNWASMTAHSQPDDWVVTKEAEELMDRLMAESGLEMPAVGETDDEGGEA